MERLSRRSDGELGISVEIQLREINEKLERRDRFIERQLSSSVSELLSLVDSRMSMVIERTVYEIRHTISETNFLPRQLAAASAPQKPSSSLTSSTQGRSTAREISHALLTPLARIQAASQLLDRNATDSATGERVRNIRAAVQVCYVYLNAFRATHFDLTENGRRQKFSDAIRSAAEVYLASEGRHRRLSIDSPDQIDGVEEYYLLASALPLIENAVDATKKNQVITIRVVDLGSEVSLSVSNKFAGKIDLEKIFQDGFSTKIEDGAGAKHEGLGLGIVQNLVGAIAGASVFASQNSNTVTFTVRMPKSL